VLCKAYCSAKGEKNNEYGYTDASHQKLPPER
jgi:hypothetical protein